MPRWNLTPFLHSPSFSRWIYAYCIPRKAYHSFENLVRWVERRNCSDEIAAIERVQAEG
jgi:hypothetical protein